jgi:hypothetical protein
MQADVPGLNLLMVHAEDRAPVRPEGLPDRAAADAIEEALARQRLAERSLAAIAARALAGLLRRVAADRDAGRHATQ